MKFVFSLFIMVLITKECQNNKSILVANPQDNIEKVSEINQLHENITLEYKAISRGSYSRILITHSTVLVQKDRNSEEISKACNEDDWSRLMSTLNTIDLKNISKFEAPTKARLYDGAASALIIIMQENATFQTNSFDHGKPPKEVEALVTEILSIAENIEKH